MSRRRIGVLLTTCALALTASTLGQAPVGAQDDPAGGEAPETPEVEVLDRGDQPREELRYVAPAGTTQTVEMRTYARISQTVDGRTGTGTTPQIRFTIDASVSAVDGSGNLSVGYTYSEIDVGEGATADDVRDQLEPLIGLSGSMVLSPSGAVLSSDLPVPEGLEPAAAQVIEQLDSQASQLTVPLPDEAVGEGARWRGTTEPELGGIQFRQTATYTLERARKGQITLGVELRQRARRQEFTPTGATESLTLLSSRGKGSGSNVLDLATAVLPVGGELHFDVDQRLRAQGERVSQTTSTSLFVNEDLFEDRR